MLGFDTQSWKNFSIGIKIQNDLNIIISDSINVIAVAEWSESLAMPGFDTQRWKNFFKSNLKISQNQFDDICGTFIYLKKIIFKVARVFLSILIEDLNF